MIITQLFVSIIASVISVSKCMWLPDFHNNYWKSRENFIHNEESKILGYKLTLTQKEVEVSKAMMRYKTAEYDAGVENPGKFPPAMHFFDAKPLVDNSTLFTEYIRKIPKGAVLHTHTRALVSSDHYFHFTYTNNLYVCSRDYDLVFRFFRQPDDTCDWKLLADLRAADPRINDYVRMNITLVVKNPREKYPNINVVWKAFQDIFIRTDGLFTYRPVFESYIYRILQEHYDDNVMYIEMRDSFEPLYDLDGKLTTNLETCETIIRVVQKFKAVHPDFLGVRMIYAPRRKVDETIFEEYVKIAVQLKQTYPAFIAGFDLVGQEDLGVPLTNFIAGIKELSSGMDFFFHAGETNWYGTSVDMNLIDAVLLNTKRIGHGYALTKHPDVLKLIKKKKIAIEVSPLSNQVLMLVEDLRNHPANTLIAEGYPVVICSDDPGFWGAKGLSYDWYMTFLGMTSRNADLRVLKQLAINSIIHSAIFDKVDALIKWKSKWDDFIDKAFEDITEHKSMKYF